MQLREITEHPLQKWQQAVWLLIALLTPLFVNLWVEQQFEASKVWLLRILVGVLALLWLVGWLVGIRLKPISASIRNLVIALLLILALSTLLSTYPTIAIFGTLDRANGFLTQLSYLLLFVCVATQIDSQGSRHLLAVIVLTAVPICLIGLAQAAGWQPLPVFTDARSLITTTLGRANFTGAYLALLLPLTLTTAQSAVNKWQRISWGVLAALELIIIALTQARAAWIAVVVGIAVLLWLQAAPRWSRRVRWVSGMGGIAGLAGVLLIILQRAIGNASIAGGGSIAARWTIWQASLRLLWPRLWLGYGADTLELHFPAVYPPQLVYYQGRGVVVDRAHNWLLDWSLNYGVVATAIFTVLVVLILRQGWQRLIMSPNNLDSSLDHSWLAACMASVCAQLVGNLFLFDVAATAVVFWLLLAIVIAAPTNRDPQVVQLTIPPWTRIAVIVTAAFIVGWAIWLGSARPLLADLHSWRGTQALGQGNPAAALVEYETAVAQQPFRTAYHVAAALTAAQLGRFEQAEEVLRRAIGLRPTDPVLYTQLAAVYAREAFETEASEKIELAYEAYEQAIVFAPTIALTYQQYADLALRSGDSAAAQGQAQRAVDLDATDGIAFGILGWAQLQAGNLAAAQDAFTQAVKWQPDSPDYHLGLATVYFQQGRFDAARQAVTNSLVRDPAYAPALTLQLELQEE